MLSFSMRGLLAVLAFGLAVTTANADDGIFEKISAGDKAAVELALASGADVDSRASDQATPLLQAALDDQPAIAELLIGKGADVMARNSGGFTPLHAAAYSGSLPIVKLLLAKGAVIEDTDNKAGVSPLLVSGEENHLDVAEFFIAQGADVNHAEIHGYLPITRAFWKGNFDIVKLFKRHGATCQADKLGPKDTPRCVAISD